MVWWLWLVTPLLTYALDLLGDTIVSALYS
jgi:hypothetical protein